MGRIKSAQIKRTGEKIQEEQGFSIKFEDNKKKLEGTMPGKKIRNKVAGYITKLKKYEIKRLNNAKQSLGTPELTQAEEVSQGV